MNQKLYNYDYTLRTILYLPTNLIVYLTPNEALIFNEFDKKNSIVTYNELINAVYKDTFNSYYARNISTIIYRINKKIKSFGKIVNYNRVGYQLLMLMEMENV